MYTSLSGAILFYTEDTTGNEKIPHRPNSSIFQFELYIFIFGGLCGGTSAVNNNSIMQSCHHHKVR